MQETQYQKYMRAQSGPGMAKSDPPYDPLLFNKPPALGFYIEIVLILIGTVALFLTDVVVGPARAALNTDEREGA